MTAYQSINLFKLIKCYFSKVMNLFLKKIKFSLAVNKQGEMIHTRGTTCVTKHTKIIWFTRLSTNNNR